MEEKDPGLCVLPRFCKQFDSYVTVFNCTPFRLTCQLRWLKPGSILRRKSQNLWLHRFEKKQFRYPCGLCIAWRFRS